MTTNAAKYTIKQFVTPHLRDSILKELSITAPTYYSKINAKIGTSKGFEVCELVLIGTILNRPLHELISPEAIQFYAINDKKEVVCQ